MLGKQIDKGLIPNNCFKNESQANSTITETLRTMFKLPLCLGIYDEKIIQYIKLKEIKSHGNDTKNTYYIDSNYLLKNHYGETHRETVRSDDPQRPCKRVLPMGSRAERCQSCTALMQNTNMLRSHNPKSDQSTHSDSITRLSNLSFEQLTDRYKSLKRPCDYWKSRARYYMKTKKVKALSNFKTSSTNLGKLVDTAVKEKWLNENSILYLLIMDALIGLKRQEKQFLKSDGKLTRGKKKPRVKGMRYHPLVVKWRCSLATKCREKGYESIRNILPLSHWQTVKQYRQTTSSDPINKENLRRMVQEMERRNCKGIGGIHWDEMMIQEGIVVCKRTGELVGFENLDIPKEVSIDFDLAENMNDESYPYESESDSETGESSSSNSSTSDSDDCSANKDYLKAKMVCQFFSSAEGDFSWPVASFPIHKLNNEKLKSLVWKVI